ncbi:MAG TPA: acyl-ACP thioesterase domain-containing protein [Candidatus Limnocylindrales bacterium]|nr:acyl-ACP thioesterase domain-containing protein [Candidatus Limnocylindrales bacterium]
MTHPPELVAGVTVPYRVRFDECGPDGVVRTSALLRYAQDVAWIHSERLGFDRAWYAQRRLAWVVRAAELGILADVPLGSTLSITTRISGFRKVWARRRTDAFLPDGTLVMWGHTDWVMTDHRGMPGRVPPEFPAAFTITPGSFEPGRVPLPPTPESAQRIEMRVRPQDVDPMGHVNNAAYVDYLEESVAAAGEPGREAIHAAPRRVRIEYVLAATPGSTMSGAAWQLREAGGDGGGWAWRLTDGDGGPDITRGRVLPGV